VIVFKELDSLTPSPTSRYDVADVAEFHVNVSESMVELTNVQSPVISGADDNKITIKYADFNKLFTTSDIPLLWLLSL